MKTLTDVLTRLRRRAEQRGNADLHDALDAHYAQVAAEIPRGAHSAAAAGAHAPAVGEEGAMTPTVDRFLLEARLREGKPYLWRGKGNGLLVGPGPSLVAGPLGPLADAYDCSGLVTVSLFAAGGPDWRATWWTGRMWSELPEVRTPRPGDLVLYAADDADGAAINHVMLWMGDGRVFGACGGGGKTTTLEIALAQGAKVQYRPHAFYRPGFRGFRALPLNRAA